MLRPPGPWFAPGDSPGNYAEGVMYETPLLERYGRLRELTLGGGDVPFDGLTMDNDTDGCPPEDPPGASQCRFPS